MNLSKRVVSILLILAIVLFLGMLFWPFVLKNIIQPVGLVVWLLLRILVLSIHQKYFWYAVIFAAFFVLFRLLPEAGRDMPADVVSERNTTMINLEFWRGLFIYNGQSPQDEKFLKQRLTNLLTALYASQQSTSNDFHLYDALKQGRIPLPGKIHTYLFPQETPEPGGSLPRLLQSIRETPQKWIRRWTGQDKAEHYQRIEDVLNFLETSLEIKHDDGTPSQIKH